MGNLLTSMVAFGAPLITKEILIPNIMHPYRYGGIPFKPPSTFYYAFLFLILNLIIIWPMAFISGLMTSSKECNKIDLRVAFRSSLWPISFAIMGIIFVSALPTLKAPLLSVVGFIPYSSQLVSGLYIAIFVMIGGMIGNRETREKVCA